MSRRLQHITEFTRPLTDFIHHLGGDHKTLISEFLAENPKTDINAFDEHGYTPLFVAVHNDRPACCSLLIERGAEIEKGTRKGQTPLMCAAQCNHVRVTKLLIEKGGADIHAQMTSDLNLTPLIFAASNQASKICTVLLKLGAAVDQTDALGHTPLMFACADGCFEVVKVLCDHGALLWLQDYRGETAFDIALSSGHHDIARFVESYPERTGPPTLMTILRMLASDNEIMLANYLKRHPLWNLNESDEASPRTPLTYLVEHGFSRCCKVLLLAGADVNAGDSLITAVEEDRADIIKVLVEGFNANVNARSPVCGETALHVAAATNNLQLCSYLISNHANVSAFDHGHATPLIWAAARGHLDVVKLLCEEGQANVLVRSRVRKSAKNVCYKTALEHAELAGHTQVVEYLWDVEKSQQRRRLMWWLLMIFVSALLFFLGYQYSGV